MAVRVTPYTAYYYDEDGHVRHVSFMAGDRTTADKYARNSIYRFKSMIKLEEGTETNE